MNFIFLILILTIYNPRISTTTSFTKRSINPHIPLGDFKNYHYYAIKVEPDAPIPVFQIAKDLGFHLLGNVGELSDYYLLAAEKGIHTNHLKKRLESVSHISWFNEQVPRRLHKRKPVVEYNEHCRVDESVVNVDGVLSKREVDLERRAAPVKAGDKLAKLNITDPDFKKQWHLVNYEVPGNDINVTDVWLNGYSGKNVVVSFIDDGLDYTHPDLKDNFYLKGSYDFNDQHQYPTPKLYDDHHGTRCAGEVAAIRNEYCGVGVAWGTKVSGIRILSGDLTEADEAAAINYDFHNNHIYSCSWGPADNGQAMDAPPKIVAEAFVNGINNGRNGLGSLFIFATGNGGIQHDNCNFDGYTNSIFTITVGAIDRYNNHPEYSEECSAQMVVTYSSGSGGFINTADWPEKCSHSHGGTSAAAPLASGIYALVMSIRPDFTWRDFQHVSVRSAVVIQSNDESWAKVAKDRLYSHKYGYGKLDAYRIVEIAKNFVKVNKQTRVDLAKIEVEQVISKQHGVTSEISISNKTLADYDLVRLEHVTVTVSITHPRRGDVQVTLVSPNNYESILATRRNFDGDGSGFRNWTFMSVKHWEENPVGKWTLKVSDAAGNNGMQEGVLHHWYLTLFGESSVPINNPPTTPTTSSTLASTTTSTTSSTSSSTSTVTSSSSISTQTEATTTQATTTTATVIPTNKAEDDHSKSSNAVMIVFALMGFMGVLGASWYLYRRKRTAGEYRFEELDDERMLNETFGEDDQELLFNDEFEMEDQ